MGIESGKDLTLDWMFVEEKTKSLTLQTKAGK